VCACECLHLSLLPTTRATICSQEPDKRHGLYPNTSGVCSCLLGSGTCWLHTIMFETSTYMSFCMSICLCVCRGACLQRCTCMSHNTTHTYTHARTHTHTHTPHYNDFFTRLLLHKSSPKVGPNHPNYSDELAPPS